MFLKIMTASIILPSNLLLDGERHAPLHPGADGAGDGEVEHQRQVGRPAPLRRPEHGARVQPRVRTPVHRGQQDRGHPGQGLFMTADSYQIAAFNAQPIKHSVYGYG